MTVGGVVVMKCIILAGGLGERLWPISRELYPKSLLNFFGNKTLIQNTFELASLSVSPKNIITITNIRQYNDTKLQLQKYTKNPVILAEPMSKNTAPAIASALTFLQSNKDEYVLIMPVDFNIDDKDIFKQAILEAKNTAKQGYIVTLGCKPRYKDYALGFIKAGDVIKNNVKKVEKFIEKPLSGEIEFSDKKNPYLWNCGIYISKISVLLEAYEKYAPEEIKNFSKNMFDENNKIFYEYYENIPERSIDYVIMEKAENMAVVELKTKWMDYGSWSAIYSNEKKGSKKNILKGNIIENNVENSFVYSSKELVAVSDIKDTIVIETEDAVLVCDKSRASDIGKIVQKLKKQKNGSVYSRKTVFRPWGYYTCLNQGLGWLSKIITVLPGHKLSLQSHNYRSEHWVVLEGVATVVLEDKTYNLQKQKSIDIPIKAKHSLQNHTKETLKILEVQKGTIISEDDIIRYEDMYGRIK